MEPEATIRVMLISAVWRTPEVFAGWIDVQRRGAVGAARYHFRAEKWVGECRFTRLQQHGERELADFGNLSESTYATLAFALGRAVELLHARTLQRFGEGRSPADMPAEMDDLGFEVSHPLHAADDEMLRVVNALAPRGS
ncbi:MAG: hypothetical protein ACKVPX_08560 [Myxococcaceae bacterium]